MFFFSQIIAFRITPADVLVHTQKEILFFIYFLLELLDIKKRADILTPQFLYIFLIYFTFIKTITLYACNIVCPI